MSKSSIRWPEARIWTTATWTSARFSARLMSSFVMFTNLVDAIMFIDTLRLRHRCGCVNPYALLLRQSRRCACVNVLSATLGHLRPTVCHARGGACSSCGGLARGVAVTVTGAVQGQYIAGCCASLAIAADVRPCFSNFQMGAATGAVPAVAPPSRSLATPTIVSHVGVSRVSSVPMLVVGAVYQSWFAADARACLSQLTSTVPLSIVLATAAAPASNISPGPTAVTRAHVSSVSSVPGASARMIGVVVRVVGAQAPSAASEQDEDA